MAKKNIGDAIKKEVKSVAKKAENVNSLSVDVRDIQISKIKANENNFFSVEEDEKFASLVESIKENGVVEPVIVVDDGDGTYTMISGHRRMKASQVVGNKTIPARIKHSLDEKDKMIYATHGHNINCDRLPPLHKGDILLHGHTHIPDCKEMPSFTYINPGSVSIPKENSEHSYMTLEGNQLSWKNLDGVEYNSYTL